MLVLKVPRLWMGGQSIKLGGFLSTKYSQKDGGEDGPPGQYHSEGTEVLSGVVGVGF